MHYVIHCLDHPDNVQRRLDNYEAHKAYLGTKPISIVISGPVLADDEATMIGSCFLVEAGSLGEAEAFNANDPFKKAGVWEKISIRPFLKRMDNRS